MHYTSYLIPSCDLLCQSYLEELNLDQPENLGDSGFARRSATPYIVTVIETRVLESCVEHALYASYQGNEPTIGV